MGTYFEGLKLPSTTNVKNIVAREFYKVFQDGDLVDKWYDHLPVSGKGKTKSGEPTKDGCC